MSDFRRTEQIHPQHQDLDQLSPLALVNALVEDGQSALRAVQQAAPALAAAVEAALPRLQAGGRLIYLGAGTSGRLGMLDASELSPTFSWPPEKARALIAGGPQALQLAIEGAEDDDVAAVQELQALEASSNDVLIAIAASGTTPYVLSGVRWAATEGLLTIGLANNPGVPLLELVHYPILLDTGPEVISGSTRLKAGTAQKMALNTLSSALMVRLGKVYGNLMVDLRATNQKLEARALRLVQHATGVSGVEAQGALRAAGGQVKTAIVMLKLGVNAAEAERRLQAVDGHARKALEC